MSGYYDHFGEYHPDDESDSVFAPGSKLQGQALLQLQRSLTAPITPAPWPDIYGSAQYAMAQELLNVTTKDGVPRVMTISFGCIAARPVSDGATPDTEVVAIVELGIGGLAYIVYIDFVQGVQFAISTNHIKINALYIALPGSVWVPPADPTAIPTYNVGAALSLGTIAHGRQPQRTICKAGALALDPPAAPGDGDHEVWNIPPFTKSCKLTAIPNNASLQLSVNNLAGLGPAIYTTVAYPSVDLPIPSDSRFFWIANTGQQGVNAYRIVCDLAL